MATPNGAPRPGPKSIMQRHDSQFASNPLPPSHSAHQEPRRYPTQSPAGHPSSTTTPRNGQYPPQSALRHPTPVVEEIDDDAPTWNPAPPIMHPQQHQSPAARRFDASSYNRNVPDGQQAHARSAPFGAPGGGGFKQNGQQAFMAGQPRTQSVPQGRPGLPGAGRHLGQAGGMGQSEEAMRKEYHAQMAAAGRGEQRPQQGQNRPNTQSQPRGPRPGPPARPGRPGQGPNPNQPNPALAARRNGQALATAAAGGIPDDEVESFGMDEPELGGDNKGGKAGVTGGELVKRGVAAVKQKAEPILPPAHFKGTPDLAGPFTIARATDITGIKSARNKEIQAAFEERQKATDEEKKHLQWDAVSNVFEKQQQNLEKSMAFYNNLISRFNDLAEIKNKALQEKEDLTDRYRRAGATLSTQCVTLQSSTNQVRLPEVKKRRLITDGKPGSGSAAPGTE